MDAGYNKYLFGADAILVTHFAFVAFVVLGLAFIWVGHFAGLGAVRNVKFRLCHVLAMGIVLCQSLLGRICPLTEWENSLRIRGGAGQAYETSFMQEWVHRIMFFDLSTQAFAVIYTMFFLLILLTIWKIPPARPRG
ncbi:MAG: DUF2784 domain-containing protein [Planctomycetes bacterium]|nr:DUF2784 domain-containing protein [Planctomycetota bacterium]